MAIGHLEFPKEETLRKLQDRIKLGESLLQETIGFESLQRKLTDWNTINKTILGKYFSIDKYLSEYNQRYKAFPPIMGTGQSYDKVKYQKETIQRKIDYLNTLIAQIKDDLIEYPQEHAPSGDKPIIDNKKIFIVHGRDELMYKDVEVFLLRQGLDPIILSDQANGGKTIIEKLEDNTNVGYGIILYTPCDEGRLKGHTDFKPRARQNVVLEHGYLMAKLGRNKVTAIMTDENIEPPSDILGIVYIQKSEWKEQLRKELKSAGLELKN